MSQDEGIQNADEIPSYIGPLAAFHREFQKELQAAIDLIPFPESAAVLDLGCGDGFYSALIAERLGREGAVLGLDANRALLARARKEYSNHANLGFAEGSVDGLEQYRNRFDFVWCAQSLFSFENERQVLKNILETLRPGGVVAILENDSIHQLLLPWPPSVELTLRMAELKEYQENSERPQRFYVGRRLPQLLSDAGLKEVEFRTQAIDRRAPLSADLSTFLEDYLKQLFQRSQKQLSGTEQERLHPTFDGQSPNYPLANPQLVLTWINVLAWGRK